MKTLSRDSAAAVGVTATTNMLGTPGILAAPGTAGSAATVDSGSKPAPVAVITDALGGNRNAALVLVSNPRILTGLSRLARDNERLRLRARLQAGANACRAAEKMLALMRDEPGHAERSVLIAEWEALRAGAAAAMERDAAELKKLDNLDGVDSGADSLRKLEGLEASDGAEKPCGRSARSGRPARSSNSAGSAETERPARTGKTTSPESSLQEVRP